MSALWRVLRRQGLPYHDALARQTAVRERVRERLMAGERSAGDFEALMNEVAANEQMAAQEVLVLEMEVAKLRAALTDITATLA